MRRATTVVRVITGLLLVPTGVSKLAGTPQRDQWGDGGWQLITALRETDYLWQAMGVMELLIAAALISGRFVPLAVAALAPLAVNLIGFHTIVDRTLNAAVPPAILVVAGTAYLLWTYRRTYAPLLQARTPAPAGTTTAAPGSQAR
jgi:uncharacterized membrane protein YphA (DoxX/SURF4 family)